MNRNLTSGFESPFARANIETHSDTDMASMDLPCGQRTPKYSDSPDRDSADPNFLDLNETVNVEEVLAEVEKKMTERMRTVTVKESLLYYKDKSRNPGFLGINIRFNPNHGSEHISKLFSDELTEIEKAVTKTVYDRLETLCNSVMFDHMKEAHDIINGAVERLDIKDPESGKIRTELYDKFEAMKSNFKRERVKYVAKLRAKADHEVRDEQPRPKHFAREGRIKKSEQQTTPSYFTKEGRKKLALHKKKGDHK